MRSVRALGVALALVTLLPAVGSAQEGRPFKNSWFWGAKAGAVTYAPRTGGTSSAALGGVDWMITRSTGGLYLSLDQAFLNQVVYMDTIDAADATAPHRVNLKNMLRFHFAAVAFPEVSTRVHPYVGLGIAVERLGVDYSAAGLTANESNVMADSVTNGRMSVGPLLMGGVQVRVPYVSVFAQGSFAPTQKTFYLPSGSGNLSLEVGVRYNIGSSIEN